MAGSFKDALEKSGVVEKEPEVPKVETSKAKTKWREELPEDDGKPHVPFDAPALTKPKPSKP
jgi:hypothetical protein